MGYTFDWDARKAASNLKKHGVSFQEAITVFGDPFSITISDPDHSDFEARFVDLGFSERGSLTVVSYVEKGTTLRIINARRASRSEQRRYESKPK